MPQSADQPRLRSSVRTHRWTIALFVCVAAQVATPPVLNAQITYEPIEIAAPVATAAPQVAYSSNALAVEANAYAANPQANQMLLQQYQALQTGSDVSAGGCQACSDDGWTDYNRCGCSAGLFHWFDGPGSCDTWCVGPKWGVDAGGLFMFREDADWGRVAGALASSDPPVLEDQFDHGLGGRVFVTGYNDSGWGMQVGYEGIFGWNAQLGYALGGFDNVNEADETRTLHYESQLNSVEVNFLRRTPNPWKLFTGFRYVQLDEDFLNTSIQQQVIPVPSDPVADPAAFTDTSANQLLVNRLIGFQLGTRRDAWQFGNRLTIHTFANAGVYCNKFRRDDIDITTTTVITGDDLTTTDDEFSISKNKASTTVRRDLTDIAFVGEAGLTGLVRLNSCTSLRAGYQILALDGVAQGIDAFLSPNVGLDSSTLVFHGLQFGFEYRR